MRSYILLTISLILVIAIILMMTPMPTDVQTIEPRIDKEQIVIGIISDTHIPTRAKEIPSRVFEEFEGVDLIIHAGDFVDIAIVKQLEEIAPLIGVEGNMDFDEIRTKYPELAIVKIYDYRIGVYHGSLLPWKSENIAKKYSLDVLISGHTHRPSIKKNDIIFINPGSPTNPLFAPSSIALLKVTKEKIEPELIYV